MSVKRVRFSEKGMLCLNFSENQRAEKGSKRRCATASGFAKEIVRQQQEVTRQLDVRVRHVSSTCADVSWCALVCEQTGNPRLFVCEVLGFSNKVRSSMFKVLLHDYVQQVNTKLLQKNSTDSENVNSQDNASFEMHDRFQHEARARAM